MSNRKSDAVTENALAVTDFLLPRIGPKWAVLGHRAKSVQCVRIYELIDVCRVTEVTEISMNREVRHDPFKIIDIISVFMRFRKNLSIARKICYFCYSAHSSPSGGIN
jgi:hypothetical protein